MTARWIRDEGIGKIIPAAVNALLTRLQIGTDRVARFGLTGGPPGSDKLIARALSIAPERVLPDLLLQTGDSGSAHSALLLIEALEQGHAGDIIVVGTFAQGCEITAFEVLKEPTPSVRRGLTGNLVHRIEETSYLKLLSFAEHLELDWGMRAEADQKTALTEMYRSADQILGFVGGQCNRCEAIQFPSLPACVNCGALGSQSPYPLADEDASIATYTADWLQYTPAPPLSLGLVQFDVGARLLMEITDIGSCELDVGRPVEMRFRIKDRDKMRHYERYFWKAVPKNLK